MNVLQPTVILEENQGTTALFRGKKLINDNFDLSPRGIREMLSLNKPIYECTAAYGHFGRKPGPGGSFSWEKTDKTSVFKK